MTKSIRETAPLTEPVVAGEATSSLRNEFSVLSTGELFFEDIAGRIGAADSSVDLQFYSFEADHEVEKIVGICQDAAERGVDVRILVDHLVSDPRHLRATRRMHREINDMPHMQIRKIRTKKGLGQIAVRDHKKIVTVDAAGAEPGGFVYIGGMNMTERSLQWNDFMVRMQGPAAQLIQQDFNRTWHGNNEAAVEIEDEHNPGTYLLTDTGKEERITRRVLESIEDAQERVWLETPYFHMTCMGTALKKAKKQRPDLDVRVIIPRFSNYPIDRLRAGKICSHLSKKGIQAYQYSNQHGQLNHTKLLLVDGTVLFGSSNFNSGLLAGRNAEIVVMSDARPLVSQLVAVYEDDLNSSV